MSAQIKLDDNSIMPSGEYKGRKLANVPASYLIWLYAQWWCSSEMKAYIDDNIDVLSLELKRHVKHYEE